MTTTRYQRGSIRVQHGRVYGSWRGEPGENGKRKRMSVYLGEVQRGKSKADWRDALRTHLDRYYQGLRVGVPVDATLRVFVESVFLPAHQSAWAPNTSQALMAALRKHVLDPLGDRQLTSITKAEIWEGSVSLPTPYYSHAGIVIYNGDCREILPHLPKVDAVITDPPYDSVESQLRLLETPYKSWYTRTKAHDCGFSLTLTPNGTGAKSARSAIDAARKEPHAD